MNKDIILLSLVKYYAELKNPDLVTVSQAAVQAWEKVLSVPPFIVREKVLAELEAMGSNDSYKHVALPQLLDIWWEKRKCLMS